MEAAGPGVSTPRDRLLRLGWSVNPVANVNAGAWDSIKQQLRDARRYAGTATRDVNALREIVSSTEEDVWIAFHASKLWWCRLAAGPVEEDSISKFRRTAGGWKDSDASGRRRLIAGIPGDISQLQGFRGAVCRVKAADGLRRLLGAESSPAHLAVTRAAELLAKELSAAIRPLHWKDFETSSICFFAKPVGGD